MPSRSPWKTCKFYLCLHVFFFTGMIIYLFNKIRFSLHFFSGQYYALKNCWTFCYIEEGDIKWPLGVKYTRCTAARGPLNVALMSSHHTLSAKLVRIWKHLNQQSSGNFGGILPVVFTMFPMVWAPGPYDQYTTLHRANSWSLRSL